MKSLKISDLAGDSNLVARPLNMYRIGDVSIDAQR